MMTDQKTKRIKEQENDIKYKDLKFRFKDNLDDY
jgi:hypothetical protein